MYTLSFFSQTVSTASELRKPIYWIVAAKAIDYEQMLLLMAGVKWDIREIMSQHNVYVDVLLKVMLHKECVGDCWCNVLCCSLMVCEYEFYEFMTLEAVDMNCFESLKQAVNTSGTLGATLALFSSCVSGQGKKKKMQARYLLF